MIKLAITRFNNLTFLENKFWRENNNYRGSIYGSSVKIRNDINPEEKIIIFEMNNSLNIIEGISIIKNKLSYEKYRIYSDNNYNRYIYKSKIRFDKSQFDQETIQIIKKLEYLLFKGKSHMKRGHGIQILSKIIQNNSFNFLRYFKNLFNKYLE